MCAYSRKAWERAIYFGMEQRRGGGAEKIHFRDKLVSYKFSALLFGTI